MTRLPIHSLVQSFRIGGGYNKGVSSAVSCKNEDVSECLCYMSRLFPSQLPFHRSDV